MFFYLLLKLCNNKLEKKKDFLRKKFIYEKNYL